MSEFRSKRIIEWAKYHVREGICRENRCGDDFISETPEGNLCLEHYIALPGCVECGNATSGGTVVAPLCSECQGKRASDITLVSSTLSYHDEVSGHDTISRSICGKGLTYMKNKVLGKGEFRGVDLLSGKRG